MVVQDPKAFLTELFRAAVAAADPFEAMRANLPERPRGKTVVVGAGKASVEMARAFERLWEGPLEGVVVTKRGAGSSCERIEVIEASHPVPDASSLEASRRLLDAVDGLTEDDLVVALISGGGSSLLAAPAGGLTLNDEIAVSQALLSSGAPIAAMNAVRVHLSRIKGGRLALAAHPARVVTFIISDIPGDVPELVASGPTIASSTKPADALRIIETYRMAVPEAVLRHLSAPSAAGVSSDRSCLARSDVTILASAAVSLEAAASRARSLGVPAVILSDSIEGEAREIAKVHAAIAREVRHRGRPFPRPVVLLSGGEGTVTLRGRGKGGRNTEFLLSLAIDIAGTEGIHALAADTDGIDGSEDNAGAFTDGSSVARLRAGGADAGEVLARNDAWTAFDKLGDLFVTSPTGTNVNDFRAILIG